MKHESPKAGQLWEVNGFEGLFFCIARDIIGNKHFLFRDAKFNYFTIPKDEFYSAECVKRRVNVLDQTESHPS